MSYWTYSDLFEEAGPPPTPFHGGFGLITREGIRKPAFFAYKYLNALRGTEIATADEEALATSDGRRTGVLVWDWTQPKQDTSNRPFFTKVHPSTPSAQANIEFAHLKPGSYRLTVRRTGFRANDAQTEWLEMGSPNTLSSGQLQRLQSLSADRPETDKIVRIGSSGRLSVPVRMNSNDVVLLLLEGQGGHEQK